ncbi:WD40 repeat [Aphelenchoides avenae]|nr:WD40 repeat [Aphelenchus avenae]
MAAHAPEENCGSRYPQELDAVLDPVSSGANSCQFNRTGSMIAVGSTDGRVAIIDYATYTIVRSWTAHAGPITSVCWSRDSRRLLTAACDGTVAIWNVLNIVMPEDRFHFGAGTNPVYASFNPGDDQQILVFTTVAGRPPFLLDLGNSETLELTYRSMLREEAVCTVAFDHRGEYVLCGTNKGRILVFGTQNGRIANVVSQQEPTQIKNFAASRRGGFVLTNSEDTILCYSLAQILRAQEGSVIKPSHGFADVINNTTWTSICVSPDGDYVCGASAKTHTLCIWGRNSGNLVKTLNGTLDKLIFDVQWHPTRTLLLLVASGLIAVWAQVHVESWRVFEGLTEVKESLQYHERENEFDFAEKDTDDEKDKAATTDARGEVDVALVKPSKALWWSGGEREPDDFSLAFDPQVDLLEDPLYKFERKAVDGDRQPSDRGRKRRAGGRDKSNGR